MTAIAAGRSFGRGGSAVAPASATAALRRVVGTLHEPNAWTAGILLATGIAVIARHPIAHALGTESDSAPTQVGVPVATAAPHPAAAAAPAVSLPTAVVPTHAPRNPFAALVTAGSALLPPGAVAAAPQVSVSTPTTPTTPTTVPSQPAAGGSCVGHVHHVVSGDSLWTLAARAVHSSDVGLVTVAWHRLYAANRSAVGSDPSLLLVGTNVCVPSSL